MTHTSAKVLLIDDDSDAVLSLARLLKAKAPDLVVEATAKISAVENTARQFDPDVLVLDLTLIPSEGPASGFKMLTLLVTNHPNARIIVLTGDASSENGVKALERGAAHFLPKPAEINHLLVLIRDGIALSQLKRSYERTTTGAFDITNAIVGTSTTIARVREEILAAARTIQTVLITGETGTGKGLCALALHEGGPRASHPFVRYQPSFGSGDLVLSELFGHKKGSFTGAANDRTGLIKRAEHGTLFLDEIDELPSEVQVALLGVIQERKYRPLGADTEISCDVRFVAASNRPINESLEKGKLRKDLFYRVSQRSIVLPPLRERMEDVAAIADSVIDEMQRRQKIISLELAGSAIQKLRSYNFPGNVRELQAVVEDSAYRAQVRGDVIIQEEDIVLRTGTLTPEGGVTNRSFHEQVDALKRKLVQQAMHNCNDNQVQAAKLLGLDRSSFRRILATV